MVPYPGFQEKFVRSLAKIRFLPVGNQGGKTHICAWEHACFALGVHPYKKIPVKVPNTGIIVSAKSFKDGIEDEIVPKLKLVTGSYDIASIKKSPQGISQTIHWKSGSVTYLMSAEQDDVAFESKTIHHWWIDEPVRRHIYVALMRGTLATDGFGWISCTPLSEPWMYDELYLPGQLGTNKDIEIFEGSTDENLSISEKQKDLYFNRVLSEEERETRRSGKFRHLEGRVFKGYKSEHYIDPFNIPPHWPVSVSIDPHPRKPHAVLYVAHAPHGLHYACNEIYTRCTIEELAHLILDLNEQYNIHKTVIDTSSQQDDWRRKSAREMLEEAGVRTQLAQKKNLKNSGILLINELFETNKMFVFRNCVRLHRELTLQTYKKNMRDDQKVLEEPEKKFDDQTDNLRYVLVERPDFQLSRIKTHEGVYRRT